MSPAPIASQFVALSHDRQRDRVRLHAALFAGDRLVESQTLSLSGRRTTHSRANDNETTALRRIVAGRRLVADQAPRVTETLLAIGATPAREVVDLRELIEAVLPRLANLPLDGVAAALGIKHDAAEQANAANLAGRLYLALLGQLSAFDDLTLQRVATHAGTAGWSSTPVLLELALGRGDDDRTGAHRLASDEIAFMGNRERPESLKPTGSRAAVNDEEIEAALGRGGLFSRENARFEFRPAQVALSQAVGDALEQDGWLMAEAGTGTGKSLAYLLPAALFARERGERIVISTNTRALQDQLIGKDVPELDRALREGGRDAPRVAVLKGRANYLCLRRWFHAERQPAHGPADASMRAKVNLWLPRTETGDRAELALTGEEHAAFGAVSAEGEACIPAKCVFQQRNQCFLYRARREAEAAHLLVVNHALLMTDLGDTASVLPPFERLILDEAHHLEDQATNQFGFAIGESTIAELVERASRFEGTVLAGALPEAAALLLRSALTPEAIERAATARDRLRLAGDHVAAIKSRTAGLFARLRRLVSDTGTADVGFGRELRVTAAIRNSPGWSEAELAADHLNAALRDLEADLTWYLALIEAERPRDDEEPTAELYTDFEFVLVALLQEFADISARLREQMLNPRADGIYWIEVATGSERTTLHAAPLNVGAMLKERVYEKMRTVVMTSATLTTDDSFDFMKARLGFEEAEDLELPSPFDYRTAAKLFLVDDIPEPQQSGYQQGVEDALIALGTALQGRTLALFTSYGALRATYRAIRDPLGEAGVDVLAQGTHGSPGQLVERLRTGSHTMVLGTATFWEGVDVVGPALSALVIAKLPFAVPSDPVFAARSELVDEPFMRFAVPQAVLRFKQGFGRLIRSSQDRGVCAMLDRRVLTKRYGRSFIQSLPECTVEVGGRIDLAASAVAWLER